MLIGKRWILLLLVLVGCERTVLTVEDEQIVQALSDTVQVPQEATEVLYVVTEDGYPRFQVSANRLIYTEDSDTTTFKLEGTLQPVEAYIFADSSRVNAQVEAQTVWYDKKRRRLYAIGAVRVLTGQGRMLRTERLVWYEKKRALWAPGYVEIETPQEYIRGYSLRTDERLESFALARVTGQVTIEQ